MITEGFNDETLRGILFLEQGKWPVTVCGSRANGTASKSSDFDFVTDDVALIIAAENAHFVDSPAQENGYLDDNTVRILARGECHLIQCRDLPLRIRAREYIDANGLNRKSTDVWNEVYEKLKAQ